MTSKPPGGTPTDKDGGARQPLKGTNPYITRYLLRHVFPVQYPKTYRKSSRCGRFEAKHPIKEIPKPRF